MPNLVLAVAVVLAAACFAAAQSTFVERPLEELTDEAEVVVLGKVARVEAAAADAGKRGTPPQELAVIAVSEVLKGPQGIKEVKVQQPAAGAADSATDVRFNKGIEGVWLLRGGAGGRPYAVSLPAQFQPRSARDKLEQIIRERAALPAGDPVNGLVARAEVLHHNGQPSIRFSLKNVSNAPLTLCDYTGGRPLQVEIIGPDGKAVASDHYEYLKRARLAPIAARNFVTLPPEGVLFLGARGRQSVLSLDSVAEGPHKITMGYRNNEDGSAFGLKGVWMGAVKSNTVTVARP